MVAKIPWCCKVYELAGSHYMEAHCQTGGVGYPVAVKLTPEQWASARGDDGALIKLSSDICGEENGMDASVIPPAEWYALLELEEKDSPHS